MWTICTRTALMGRLSPRGAARRLAQGPVTATTVFCVNRAEVGVDADGAAARHADAGDSAAGHDLRAVSRCLLRERVRGGDGVGVAGAGLVHAEGYAVGADMRHDPGGVVRRDCVDIHSQLTVHLDVQPRRVRVAFGQEHEPAGLTEPGIAADGVGEVAEHLAGLR